MEKVTPLQIYMLFTQFLISTMASFVVTPLVQSASYGFWIPLCVGSLIGLGIAYLTNRLALRRPDQYFMQYGHQILGKPLHYPLVCFLIISYLLTASFNLRQFTDFLIMIYLPETPSWAVVSLVGLCIARLVHSGGVTIFRSSQGVFFLTLILLVIIAFGSANSINPYSSVAMLTHTDFKGIVNGVHPIVSLFGELSIIIVMFPLFTRQSRIMKSMVWAVLTAVILSIMNIAAIVLLFGPELTVNLTYPNLEMTRYIKTGNFTANLDPVLIFMWLFALLVKMSLFVYATVLLSSQAFGLKDAKPLSLPLTALMIGMSLWLYPSITDLDYYLNHGGYAINIIASIIPVLYFIVDSIRSRSKKSKSGQTSVSPADSG